MIVNYKIITLNDLVENQGEETVKKIIETFECFNNKDVDKFLKEKAIVFDRQNLSKTHLVFTSFQQELVLVGYYTIANKSLVIKNTSNQGKSDKKLSKNLKRRINKFAQLNKDTNQYVLSAPLIGQLGKNDRYKTLISGDILLSYACDTVKRAQSLIGGKIVYLECEDKPCLLDFYYRNGFVNFGKRYLEYDEKDDLNGTYLIQMVKYLK